MLETIIDRLFSDNQALIHYLQDQGEISLSITADNNFRKTLLMSAASFFESRLCEELATIFSEKTNHAEPFVEFLKNKAITRQYHTYFDWELRNANRFFSLFGVRFRQYMVEQVRSTPEIDNSIRSFLELGRLRNELTHQNFASFPMDKTTDEIYQLYKSGLKFVEDFPEKLKSFLDGITS